jgi:ATP-binding cassette, subfamily B, bacterial PglK
LDPINHIKSLGLVTLLGRLWRHISQRRRIQFGLLFGLMLAASFAEMCSIGAVLPFLSVLTTPDRVFINPSVQPIVDLFGFTQPIQMLLPLTVVFIVASLLAGFMRLLLLWASTRLTYAAGADLSISIYRRTLYQPYAVHCQRNSSEIINGISNKTGGVIYIITQLLTLAASGLMLVGILAVLLSVDPAVALAAFGGFGCIYLLIIRMTRSRLLADSSRVARESTRVIKCLQEGLGGIRDVLIDGSQSVYCDVYRSADLSLRQAQGSSSFIQSSPRYAMEALGMTLIAGLAYVLAQQQDGVASAIPVLGALALGAQRLLPVLQQAYGAWTGIQGGVASLQDALDLLDQPLPRYATQPLLAPIPFRQHIKLESLSFRYRSDGPQVLDAIDLYIPRGGRVGFVGTTGSGKSTLLDLIMGLLEPTEGLIQVDGIAINAANQRSWQSLIAHVPQAIFLADTTIEENIAFGVPKDRIDPVRVSWAAEQAQIASSIELWPQGYQTMVGERGVRLSGGQRQRIGIARAIYKEAKIFIFDEATSALDGQTEQAVMRAIVGLGEDVTLLIIAHRLSTLQNCTQIVELEAGRIRRVGSYHDIVNKSMNDHP